jgi:hypothetical protein
VPCPASITLSSLCKSLRAAGGWGVTIIDNQLGRRNLTPEQREYLLGKRYNREKASHGGDRKSEEESSGKSYHLKTAERLAEQYKVSEKTVRNAGQFAEAVDTLVANVGGEVRQKVLAGDSTLTKESIIVLAKESPEKQKKVFARGEAEILKAAKEIKRERG